MQVRDRLLRLALFALVGVHAYSQNITGYIVGNVTDASGSAVPGTVITVRNVGTGVSVTAAVDSSGTYSVPNLFAGRYDIEAKKEGFQVVSAKNLQLLAAQTVRQDFTLQIGQVAAGNFRHHVRSADPHRQPHHRQHHSGPAAFQSPAGHPLH